MNHDDADIDAKNDDRRPFCTAAAINP